MAKKPMGLGRLPKRPSGPMTEPKLAEGFDRAHWFDQLPGQPRRVAPPARRTIDKPPAS